MKNKVNSEHKLIGFKVEVEPDVEVSYAYMYGNILEIYTESCMMTKRLQPDEAKKEIEALGLSWSY